MRRTLARRMGLGALKLFASGALLWFVVRQMLDGVAQVRVRDLLLEPLPLAAASVLMLGFFLGTTEAWRRLVTGLGGSLSFAAAFRAMYLANITRYLPGSLWWTVGRAALASRAGVPPTIGGASVVFDVLFQVIASLIVLCVLSPGRGLPPFALWLVLPGALVGLHPRVCNLGLSALELLIRRRVPRLTLSFGQSLTVLLLYAAAWMLAGLAFALLGNAVRASPLSAEEAAALAGIYGAACNAGAVAFFLPAGLGARELAVLHLSQGLLTASEGALLALLSRVWVLAFEVVLFASAHLVGRERSVRPAEADAGG